MVFLTQQGQHNMSFICFFFFYKKALNLNLKTVCQKIFVYQSAKNYITRVFAKTPYLRLPVAYLS